MRSSEPSANAALRSGLDKNRARSADSFSLSSSEAILRATPPLLGLRANDAIVGEPESRQFVRVSPLFPTNGLFLFLLVGALEPFLRAVIFPVRTPARFLQNDK